MSMRDVKQSSREEVVKVCRGVSLEARGAPKCGQSLLEPLPDALHSEFTSLDPLTGVGVSHRRVSFLDPLPGVVQGHSGLIVLEPS